MFIFLLLLRLLLTIFFLSIFFIFLMTFLCHFLFCVCSFFALFCSWSHFFILFLFLLVFLLFLSFSPSAFISSSFHMFLLSTTTSSLLITFIILPSWVAILILPSNPSLLKTFASSREMRDEEGVKVEEGAVVAVDMKGG